MKQSTDPRVDAYIAKSAEFGRPILRHVRALVHRASSDVEETIKWGFPHFMHANGILCSMAAFKAHCTFGFWNRDLRAVIAREGGKAGTAMGQFGRIATLADLPDDRTMIRYLKLATKLADSGEKTPPVRKPRPALAMPTDLAAALRKNRAAAVAFEKFTPSHRREYIEWITGAKRVETRQKRIATAIERLVG